MRGKPAPALPAGPHPDPLPHAGEGTARCGFADLHFTQPPLNRPLLPLALTLTLSRTREWEPLGAVSQTCASPQHPRDRPLLPLAGEGGGWADKPAPALPAGPHPNPLPHAGEGTARCGFADLRFTSTPARSAPSPAGGRRRGMRVPACSRLRAGPHP